MKKSVECVVSDWKPWQGRSLTPLFDRRSLDPQGLKVHLEASYTMRNRASEYRRCLSGDLLMLIPVEGQGEVDWEVPGQLRTLGSGYRDR